MTRTNYIPAENRKSKLKYINAMYTAKPLKLMPYFNAVTLDMAADYLGVSKPVLTQQFLKNKEPVASLGSKILKKEDFVKSDAFFIENTKKHPKNRCTVFRYEDMSISVPPNGVRVLTPEGIFYLAMSVKSDVADVIRAKLLELESIDHPTIEVTDCDLPVEVIVEVAEPVKDERFRIFNDPEFGSVRTVVKDGEPWFVAADVCKALEIDTTATRRLDADEKSALRLTQTSSNGVEQGREMSVINEPGLYTLVLGSRKSSAKAFRRWITHDVILKIRKHGMYATDELLDNPEFAIQVFQKLKEERDRNRELSEANRNLTTTNQALVHDTRTWKSRSIVNALIRKYASKRGNNYQMAWNEFYKELAYSKHICPKLREGKGFAIDKVKESEWNDLIEVAAALCESIGINSGEVINEVNAERIHS